MDVVKCIQVAVVWADIVLCEVGKLLLYVFGAALVGGFCALVWEYRRRKR